MPHLERLLFHNPRERPMHTPQLPSDAAVEQLLAQRTRELETSQRHLAETQALAHLGSWEWDPVRDAITGSEEFYRLFGIGPAEMPDTSSFFPLLHVDDRERVQQELAAALQRIRPYDTEYRVVHPGGQGCVLRARGQVFVDDTGRPVRMVGTCQDISESKRSEERLRQLSLLKEGLLPSAPLAEKLRRITDIGVSILAADFARVWMVREGDLCAVCCHAQVAEGPHVCRNRTQCLHLVASSGRYTHLDGEKHRRVPLGVYKIGRIGIGEEIGFVTNDVQHDPRVHDHAWATQLGLVAFAGVKLTSPQGQTIGVLAVFSQRVLTAEDRAFLEMLAGTTSQVLQTAQAEADLQLTRFGMEHAGDLIFWITPEGRIVEVNQSACQNLGYSREELLALTIPDISLDHLAANWSLHWQDLKTRGVLSFETQVRCKDGRTFPIEITANYICFDGREFNCAMVRDITERKRSMEMLAQHARELAIRNQIAEVFLTVSDEETYTCVLDIVLEALSSPDGVFGYIDEQGALVVPSMTRNVWDRCQVPDKQFLFPRETWGDSIWPRSLRQQQTLWNNEPSTKTPDGHVVITRNISLPILHRGEVIGLFQVANRGSDYTDQDIRLLEMIGRIVAPALKARLERERHDAARQRLLESLDRSNQQLEQFAYVASHDLQEPLRMVASYTQLLAQRYGDQLDQDARDFIGYAVGGATRMQQLIQDLLEYSRVTSRGKPPARLAAAEPLAEAIGNLQAMIQETGTLVTHGDLPPVLGDPTQLVQLFQNLLANAVKFRKPEESPRVQVSAERDSDNTRFWRFRVTDNGIGIDPKYFDRLFVIFQRLHSQRHYPGTGIGLATCKRIVERHGGRIWLESAPGQGTTVLFTLPGVGQET
ncbi:MAG: PAS domain S-box protein [Planctomycetota bacterium]|nr:PAS domain S-box protein [Planctomycetota bacterium]